MKVDCASSGVGSCRKRRFTSRGGQHADVFLPTLGPAGFLSCIAAFVKVLQDTQAKKYMMMHSFCLAALDVYDVVQ